jgi:hypothetical protein
MFIVATGLIAKFSEITSKTYAAAAVTFLFLYVFLYVVSQHPSRHNFARKFETTLTGR